MSGRPLSTQTVKGEDYVALGWLLRMAYVKGYKEAHEEPVQGAFFREFHQPVPKRRRVEEVR